MGITLHALEEQRDEQGCCFPPWYLPNDKQRHVNTKERKEIWAELPPLHYKLRPQHPNLQDAESKIPSPTALKSRQGGAECASVCGWSITKTTPGNNQGAQIYMDSYGDLLLRSCCLVQPLSLGGGGAHKTISKTQQNNKKPDSPQRWIIDEKQHRSVLLDDGRGGGLSEDRSCWYSCVSVFVWQHLLEKCSALLQLPTEVEQDFGSEKTDLCNISLGFTLLMQLRQR